MQANVCFSTAKSNKKRTDKCIYIFKFLSAISIKPLVFFDLWIKTKNILYLSVVNILLKLLIKSVGILYKTLSWVLCEKNL